MKFLGAALILGLAACTPATYSNSNNIIGLMEANLGATRPEGCPRAWCACYMNLTLEAAGYETIDSNRARDFRHYGEPAETGEIGAIMVMPNHVGMVKGECDDGRVLVISGNYSRRVKEGCFRESSAIAWRIPVEASA